MRKRGKRLLICTVFFMSLLSGKANALGENGRLNEQLNQALQNEAVLNGAVIGLSVRSASSGQLIYQHLGDVRLRPASNLKLFTAAAALEVLGENHTSKTEILTDGKIKGKTVKGNLYLRGNGDPTLLKTDLNEMTDALRQLRIRKIDGDLIGDDSWYDDVRYSIDLPWSDETAYYGAQISALTASPNKDYDQGTVIVEVVPAEKPGRKTRVKITPNTKFVKIINRALTVPADGKKSIKIERSHATNTIMIEGNIPVKAKKTKERVAVWDPSKYALTLFKQSLQAHGIKVKGKLKIRKAPETARLIEFHRSTPLSERLMPFMKLSNNGHGEMLIKEMGKIKKGEGSWDKGLSVLKTELSKLGINTNTLVLRDGSGISHVNLIPANQITQLLYQVQRKEWFPSYLNSLPLAGVKDKMVGGSLRNRLQNIQGKVRAKTGTLSTVSSLSGYIETKSKQRLIFSILLNNLLDESEGKKFEDKIVTILANQ